MTYKYRNTATSDLTRDIRDRIEALEIECDGIGEDENVELVQLRAQLAELILV
jgi:hypothetical protein